MSAHLKVLTSSLPRNLDIIHSTAPIHFTYSGFITRNPRTAIKYDKHKDEKKN